MFKIVFMKKFFPFLQKLGQCLMIPVAVLPAAGLMVAIGRLMTNSFGKILFTSGLAVFEQLPVIFAVGVAIGFAGGAGVAALSAVAGYFTLVNVLKTISELRHLPLAINTGVFGGIIIGWLAAVLYNRFHTVKLNPVLGFFSGKRLIPILTVVSTVFVGLFLGLAWPPLQDGINHFGQYVMNSPLGPAFYAAGKRLLIPLGLHHVYYPSFLFQFGDFTTATGQIVHGDSARYFAGDPTAGTFMASEFPIMLFGLPAAALAMTLRAPLNRRKAIAGIMFSAALTSIITGITEPIEFAFIFVAPLLFVFHVGAAFVSGLLTKVFNIHLGYTFSASLIDFGLGYFNQKNSFYLWFVIGPIIFAAYFFTFYWLIKVFNFKTPGRETQEAAAKESVPLAWNDRAIEIIAALGGASNIHTIDACITRLRLSLLNNSNIDEAKLKKLGAVGVMKMGTTSLQAVFGTESESLKEEIKKVLTLAPIKNIFTLSAPLYGKTKPLSDVPDQVFADKIMGDGIAIQPDEGVVYAPCDATVSQIFRTNHAIGLTSPEGVEILIHVGIDTVKMNGEGFKSFVQNEMKVKKGQKLIEFDLDLVNQKAKSSITPVVITNSSQFKGITFSNFMEVEL